jgi:hypothetical protein
MLLNITKNKYIYICICNVNLCNNVLSFPRLLIVFNNYLHFFWQYSYYYSRIASINQFTMKSNIYCPRSLISQHFFRCLLEFAFVILLHIRQISSSVPYLVAVTFFFFVRSFFYYTLPFLTFPYFVPCISEAIFCPPKLLQFVPMFLVQIPF